MSVPTLVYKWIVYYRLQNDDAYTDESITSLQHPTHAFDRELDLYTRDMMNNDIECDYE